MSRVLSFVLAGSPSVPFATTTPGRRPLATARIFTDGREARAATTGQAAALDRVDEPVDAAGQRSVPRDVRIDRAQRRVGKEAGQRVRRKSRIAADDRRHSSPRSTLLARARPDIDEPDASRERSSVSSTRRPDASARRATILVPCKAEIVPAKSAGTPPVPR